MDEENVNQNIKNAIEVLANTYNNIYKMFNVIEEYCLEKEYKGINIIDNSTDWKDKIYKPNSLQMEHLIKTRISYVYEEKKKVKNIQNSKDEKIKSFISKEVNIIEIVLNDEIPMIYYGKIKFKNDTLISSGKSQTVSVYYNLKKNNLKEVVNNNNRYFKYKDVEYIYNVIPLLNVKAVEDVKNILSKIEKI